MQMGPFAYTHKHKDTQKAHAYTCQALFIYHSDDFLLTLRKRITLTHAHVLARSCVWGAVLQPSICSMLLFSTNLVTAAKRNLFVIALEAAESLASVYAVQGGE